MGRLVGQQPAKHEIAVGKEHCKQYLASDTSNYSVHLNPVRNMICSDMLLEIFICAAFLCSIRHIFKLTGLAGSEFDHTGKFDRAEGAVSFLDIAVNSSLRRLNFLGLHNVVNMLPFLYPFPELPVSIPETGFIKCNTGSGF